MGGNGGHSGSVMADLSALSRGNNANGRRCGRPLRKNFQARSSHRRGDPLLELLLGRSADLPRGHLAVLEDHQRRDRLDSVFGRGMRALVDIELDDLDLVTKRTSDLLERWRDHPARTTPFRPEVDHHWAGGLQHFGFEIRVRHFGNGHGSYLVLSNRGPSPHYDSEPMNGASSRQGNFTAG